MLQEIGNHLWQSTLFLCCIGVLCAFLREENARIRYWLWWAASIKFLVPFSLLISIGSWFSTTAPIESIELTIDWMDSVSSVGQSFQPFTEQQAAWSMSSVVLAIWLAGTSLVLGVWAVRAAGLHQLKKSATLASETLNDQGKSVPVYRTQADIEPGVVGLLRPAILLPEGIENRLSASQFEAVLAHELCHIRRRDNLTAALHMLVEAVFWFHPLIWWLGFRLIDERERACDEMVVTLGHDRETYAQSILDVCEQYVATRLACAPGISGSDLKRRVIEIMNYKGVKQMEYTKKAVVSTLFTLTLALPILGGLFINAGALAQETQETRPLSKQTTNALAPVRQALSREPETEGGPRPDPNPELALQELQSINIDNLPGHEKAEVYFLFGYAYYLVEDFDQVKDYWNMLIEEPGANASLVTRTLKNLAQVHHMEEEYAEALDLYLQFISRQQNVSASDYAVVANIYYVTEDYQNALIYIERAINIREESGGFRGDNWFNLRRNINHHLGNPVAELEDQPEQYVTVTAGFPISDSDIVPLQVIKPNYPRRAAENGTEGFCNIEFTITTEGTTANHEVAECSNAMFERESIRAAQALRYPPHVVDGNPVAINQTYRFTYELADEAL